MSSLSLLATRNGGFASRLVGGTRWRRHWCWLLFCCGLSIASTGGASGGFLQLRNGYFWDPKTADYFIPRGIAYQTWNPPVGADQTYEQLEYDLIEFKKIYANSVRCEMVWNEVERSQGAFDWSRPDFLVAKAEQLGLKLFVLIGFQYAPAWFPEEWKAVNDQGSNSVVLAYENPNARNAYSNYIFQVTSRYRNRPAIGGWILGNEYAYFDLWNPDHRYLGFDPISQTSFRNFLSSLYAGNIAALNANWGTSYSGFNQVPMFRAYPADRNNPGYHDLIQWREFSIGEYVALAAAAAKRADPNHLRTYSMIGGLFIGNDANYTCEDAKTIVARCAAAGAPLDFWSINNYAWATLVAELRSGDFGISKHQAFSGLPVMVSETGDSTTDNLLPGAAQRQPDALPGQIWESLMSGAIGTHIFTWNDRDLFSGYFIREKGFGIVNQNRLIKSPVYENVREMFRRMENLKIEHLFGASSNPPPDVQLFWSRDAEMGWPRGNQENAMLWGALKRLGYEPGIIDDNQFDRGAYSNAPALLLARCYQMSPAHLDRIATNVIAAGINVHADADLPGQYNAYHRPNPNWASRMSSLFGLNVAGATAGLDSGATDIVYDPLYFTGVNSLGPLVSGFTDQVLTWKIWHGVTADTGTTIVTHTGDNGSQPPLPALQVKNLGTAKSAINTFALGDLFAQGTLPAAHDWDVRYNWLRAIYRSHFGMLPRIDLTGPGANYVIPDYRLCHGGGILISLLNGYTNSAVATLTAHALLDGKVVENLTTGGIVETNSDGIITLNLTGDQYVLLYAYPRNGGTDASLVNANPSKLWIQSAPPAVWPNGPGYDVTVGYDTPETNLNLIVSFERSLFPGRVYGQSTAAAVTGQGTRQFTVPIPDADLNDADYVSSPDGGEYILRARLEKNGTRLSEASLPVRLLWGVRPVSLPLNILPNNNYPVTLEWQELPSYDASEKPTPLSRADLWQPLLAKFQNYDVVLELRTNGVAIASDHFTTSTGTTNHQFAITVRPGVTGPFTWFAYLRPAPGASVDVIDSFEDRDPGDLYQMLTNSASVPPILSPILPWVSYNYPNGGNQQWLTEGVGTNASDGNLSAFLVVTNPAWIPDANYSGFGMTYDFALDWGLPADSRQWTNYTFSCDFQEISHYPCVVELQLNDAYGGQIHFTNRYQPGPNGWQTIRASLDQFTINPNLPYPPGFFVRGKVHQLSINVQMLQTNATYAAFFDNIRFDGPDAAQPASSSHDVLDSFEDRQPGLDPANAPSLLTPWVPYVYAEFNNVGDGGRGIQTSGSDGGQSAFEIAQNPVNPGGFSGFGMYYLFPNQWALPATRTQWSNYVFAFDFKESSGYRCVLEMQVKSSSSNWVSFTNTYSAGSNQWATIRASLDKFVTGPEGALDPAHIQSIAVNIQMLDKNRAYLGSFDNIRFDGPDSPFPPELGYGIYDSSNDSLRDSDGDGIPDVYETGTGVYVSETNTGTNPNKADTDGDGLSDRFELIAGTNPNVAADVFRIEQIRRDENGGVVLSWLARTNKVYGITYFDGNWFDGAQFCPVEGMTNIRAATNGLLEVVDPSAAGSNLRFYRITVQNP